MSDRDTERERENGTQRERKREREKKGQNRPFTVGNPTNREAMEGRSVIPL